MKIPWLKSKSHLLLLLMKKKNPNLYKTQPAAGNKLVFGLLSLQVSQWHCAIINVLWCSYCVIEQISWEIDGSRIEYTHLTRSDKWRNWLRNFCHCLRKCNENVWDNQVCNLGLAAISHKTHPSFWCPLIDWACTCSIQLSVTEQGKLQTGLQWKSVCSMSYVLF